MNRRFFALCFLFVVLTGLLSGCSWNKTTTETNSDATVVQPPKPRAAQTTISEIAEDSLLPSNIQGTKSITFAGNAINISDDGMREVFVVDTGSLADEVFAWLTTPADPVDKTQILLKQVTVSVGGSSVVIPDGAELFSHLSGYNMNISTSGNDLILSANKMKAPYESYVLIDGDLSENYLVTNPRDRFGSAVYMIPQNTPSLLVFVWGSDLQSVTLSYARGDNSRSLAYGYEDRWSGFYSLSEEVLVPGGTTVHITSGLPSSEAKLYHVVFDEKTKTVVSPANNIAYPLAKDHLLNYAEQKGFGISTFDELTITSSGDRNVTLTDAKEQAVFVVEPSYSYLFPLHNYPFLVELQKDASDEYRPYYSRFLTSYLLDESAAVAELERLFGKKNAQYTQRDKGFSYEIQPQQDYTGTLAITNIFGQTAEVNAQYRIEKMSPLAITQDIVSNNTISILPRSGVFKDVLIQYKNIPSFAVQFQACDVGSLPDVLTKEYKGVGVENYLFTCGGKIVSQTIAPQNEEFVYWKAYRTPLEIPEALSGADAFKVFFKDQRGQEQSHYLLKSDLALRTKVTDDQLRVWGFTFNDGQPIQDGTVKVTTLDGMTIGSASLVDGLAKISLPKKSDDYYDYLTQWKKDSYFVELTQDDERTFVVANRVGRGDLSVPGSSPNGNERYLKINSKLDISEVTTSSTQVNQRGMVDPVKIYGYTDRGLYKAGDTIHFAGWIRNVLRFDTLEYLKGQRVDVTITNPVGGDPVILSGLQLDAFGGFVGSYTLPSTLPLGEYFVEYRLDDRVAYSHNIKVEEYQKPTFFVEMSQQTNNDMVSLVMQPTYFFGTPLKKYDLQVTRSLLRKDICWYCGWWNEAEDYYYNYVFNELVSTGGQFRLYNQTSERLVTELYPKSLQAQKAYTYTLKVDAIVKDRLSDETQFITKQIDFQPEVKIGLSGQPYEWLYRNKQGKDPSQDRKVDGLLSEGKGLVNALRYEIYRSSYDQQLQQGVDGNVYYVNGQPYLPVASGNLAVADTFLLSGSWITEPGEYFIRVLAEDEAGEVVGEVQKKLVRYSRISDDDQDLLGDVPNNYTLTVDIPKKTYQEGEDIPVNLIPYVRDAWVVVTVERGQYIIDSFLKKLDGNQLSIPVKKGYAPNVIISVMLLQGTEMNNSVRKEPRFFAGYAEAKIDTSMHELNITLGTSKKEYLPGEPVTITITTTDDAGKPVDARVSVAVVDQALASLYTILKEPLPYFFNTVGTSIYTYTNMKLLYQSLKAFATGGSKGGAGNGGKAMFSYIREDLPDAAFRSGAVYTKGGKAQITFTAPENLTTRLIDTIAITQDTRLGTASTGFVVKKDLIIEPNAPLFVTIGDRLTVPVKVVAQDAGGKVKGSAWMVNQQGERVDLGTFEVEANKTVGLDLEIPKTRWTSRYIELFVEGTMGNAKDGIKKIIPLRSEGLISRDSVGTINKEGSHTFTLPETLTQSVSVRLAQLPTNFIDPIASYLIRYPYGCTEQLLSSLLPLITIEQLRQKGVFTSPLLSGSTVITDGGPVEIATALRDGIAKLLAHQRPDGGFGYRAFRGEEVTRGTYLLSAYVYNALMMLESLDTYSFQSLRGPLERLESFLYSYQSTAREGWYRYLLTKVTYGIQLTPEEQQSLENIQLQETGYMPLLRYLIAVAQQDEEAIKTWRLVASIPTNEDRNDTSVFLNQTTATAMKLRTLIDDPQATQQERSDLLLSLLKQRESTGLRGWSTQSNVQVLLTLNKLAEFRTPKKVVACTVKVNGESYEIKVTTGSEGLDLPVSGTTTTVDWSCDSALLADVAMSFLPVDLEKTLGAASHVSNMSWSISNPNASIGEKVDIVGSFATDLVGEQVAVELFVPSDYKLLDVISSKMPPSAFSNEGLFAPQVPFTLSDQGNCRPTHRETRFDRLFLYYDILNAGVCDITIPAVKAYSGTTTIMPMRVWEMYKGLINGRKVIVR